MPYKDKRLARIKGTEAGRRYQKKRTAAKVAKLEAKIAERPRWPEVDLAWAAGMFEGEGTITITGGGRYTRSVVCLTNTDREIVEFFQNRWPGLVGPHKPQKPNHKMAWTWRLQGNFVFGFLLDVSPFFRTRAEREKADLLLESQRARWAGYKLSGHSERIGTYRDRMRKLNQRGRQP
jgi:hypothetical protein